jgi:hypothetical protein
MLLDNKLGRVYSECLISPFRGSNTKRDPSIFTVPFVFIVANMKIWSIVVKALDTSRKAAGSRPDDEN